MSNLFSIFDPSTGSLALNWISLALVFSFPSFYWLAQSKPMSALSKIMSFITTELSAILAPKYPGSLLLVLSSLFLMILISNLFGLLPYVFTPSSHLSITLSLGFPIWAGYTFWNFMNHFSSAMAHLVPKGTPFILVPLMIIIELISNFIRPMTLSVRLAANMVAGHLLLALISGPMASSGLLTFLGSCVGLSLLTVLEIAVASIQAYVFTALTSLYISESKGP